MNSYIATVRKRNRSLRGEMKLLTLLMMGFSAVAMCCGAGRLHEYVYKHTIKFYHT